MYEKPNFTSLVNNEGKIQARIFNHSIDICGSCLLYYEMSVDLYSVSTFFFFCNIIKLYALAIY